MLHRACGQHLAKKERAQPAGPLPDHFEEADLHIGSLQGLHAAELLHVLGAFLDHSVDDVIDGHDPQHVTFLVDDRHGDKVIFGDEAGDVLAIGQRRHGQRAARRADGKNRLLRFAGDQAAERDCPHECLRLRVEHIDRIDRLPGALHPADMLQCLCNGPRRRNADKLGRHDASRRVVGIGQQLIEGLPRFDIQVGEKLLPGRRFEVPEDFGSTIGGDGLEKLDCPHHRLRHEQLSGVVQPRLVEDFRGPLMGHRQEDRRGGFNGLRVQPLDDVGNVLIRQPRRESGRVEGVNRVCDIVHGSPLPDSR
jgi:hypothetical protein